VDRLCDSVRAPRPREIHIDAQVNASASFRRGVLSFFGNDLVLTLGLPLVSGLTLRQFAGVLAHEFGHFAQGGGMRLTYVVRTISAWFARLVYERDAWDERLRAAANSNIHAIVNFTAWLMIGGVWLSRRVLWLLMWIGHLVSCYMLRQMEFDADRYEARFAGSDCFESTVLRLHELNAANSAAMSDLSNAWRERRLPDDFPRLVLANVEYVNERPEQLQQMHERILAAKTGWADTHPSDGDRVESARRERAAGVFLVEGPAERLFVDYGELCRAATLDYYREIIDDFRPESLVSTDRIYQEQLWKVRTAQAFRRYFQGKYPSSYRLFPEIGSERPHADGLAESLLTERTAMSKLMPEAHEASKQYSYYDPKLANAKSTATLERFDATAGKRLRLALAHAKASNGFGKDPFDLLEKAEPTLEALRRKLPEIAELRRLGDDLHGRFEAIQNRSVTQQEVDGIHEVAAAMRTQLHTLRDALTGLPYPFAHGQGAVDLAAYAVLDGDLPAAEDFGEIFSVAGRALDHLDDLYFRMLAGLVLLAELAEQDLGLPPLPEPPEEPAES
jgi:Zn-dependent protease with chaperone function